MRALAAAAAVLLLASCYDPSGQCEADDECLSQQVCGVDGLCVPGTRPPPGNPPVAGADAYDFVGGGPFDVAAGLGVLADDSDPGGGTLTAQLVGGPSHGAVYLAPDGGFTYAPTLGYLGTDAFTYRATNGVLSSAETTVSITVAPGPPTARPDAFVAVQDAPLAVAAAGVLANDNSDPGGRALTAAVVAGPTNGSVVLAADGSFVYTPNAGYFGGDAFTYRAADGTLTSDEATVTITVRRPPLAQADAYTVAQDVALDVAAPGVLANDSDPDGGTLAAVLVASAAHGEVSLSEDGSFTYTPAPGYSGDDAFTYRASNGTLESGETTVTLTVTPTVVP